MLYVRVTPHKINNHRIDGHLCSSVLDQSYLDSVVTKHVDNLYSQKKLAFIEQ